MKYQDWFFRVCSGCLVSVVFLGCATVKEVGKGFAGVSTRVLEQKRKESLKKTFALEYNDCYAKVKDILNLKGKESYIYAEDIHKKMIAVYLSSTDTTPVGIFFTDQAKLGTLIEVSSLSVYAKEEIANRIFGGLASDKQSQEEKRTDDKEKISS